MRQRRFLKKLFFIAVIAVSLPIFASASEQDVGTKVERNTAAEELDRLLLEDGSIQTSDGYLLAQRRTRSSRSVGRSSLQRALELAKAGNYQEASKILFQLSQSSQYKRKRDQIKYILGLMLYQMDLNQVAAFQFISLVKKGRGPYLRQSLEKLSLAADKLGDDTLLNYAISKVKISDFPKVHRDMLLYRIGEHQLNKGQDARAAVTLSKVSMNAKEYPKAKYLQGLAYAKQKKHRESIQAFDDLILSRTDKGITDQSKVAGLIGKARVLYQGNAWDRAIASYRDVPRDSAYWHDTLFESSWAMLRSGKFRSALSNFQSLHSTFYENHYQPESLLLRAIVYLYICKYEEAEKVLNLYNQIYKPVYNQLKSYLSRVKDPYRYYEDIMSVRAAYEANGESAANMSYSIPFVLAKRVMQDGAFGRSYSYITGLKAEMQRVESLPATWQNSAIGRYSKNLLQMRVKKAQKKAGRQIKKSMVALRDELYDLFEQEGFIRFEMINGKRDILEKRVAGRELPTSQIDDSQDRSYYVQNGYEYYPFSGEYWLDELGNYHYVGTQSCR